MNERIYWNCNSPKLASFIMTKGIHPVKRGIYPDGYNYWVFIYAEIKSALDEYHSK